MIKVFEAFSGYGSQRMALRNLNIPHEVVGISEIDGDAILSYAAIHTNFLKLKEIDMNMEKDDILSYLEKINAPLDYKTFKHKAKSLKQNKLQEMYLANKLAHNYGDITKIDPQELPDFDLFTYSFPCQDISVAGYQKGLNNDSGTRSSLLWECCKIIESKKPKYLMMENVKNLIGNNHKANFIQFLQYLETLGYSNNWSVLNAKDYGLPQNRERVFCISTLNKTHFVFPAPINLKKYLYNILDENVPDSYYLRSCEPLPEPISQSISYCIDANYWKGTSLNNFLTKHRRQLVTDKMNKDGTFQPRRLTPKETWRLMGCFDSDFEKANKVVSKTSLYRQAGNSIVVPVLEAIFRNLFMPQASNDNHAEDLQTGYQMSLL